MYVCVNSFCYTVYISIKVFLIFLQISVEWLNNDVASCLNFSHSLLLLLLWIDISSTDTID